MESDSNEDVLILEEKHSPHSTKSIELGNDPKNTERKPTNTVLMSSDKESVKPIETNLVDETFPKRPVPHKQAKFSFGWKKTSGKIADAKVHTVNENLANKSVESMKKVPNILTKNLLHSVSQGQFNQNVQDLKENFRNDRCETQRISNVQINSYSKKGTQNHNLESATTPSFKPSSELQTEQTDALLDLHPHNCNFTPKIPTEDEPNPTVEHYFHIPPTSLDYYIPSQILDSSSTSTPHSYYPFPEHHPFISPSANVLEDPVAAFEAAMEELDRKKKEQKLKERRRASLESFTRRPRSPHRRERHHKQRRLDYSPLRKSSQHSKNYHRSPSRRHFTHNSDSRSPPPKRSKILDLRDKINSRSPSPKTSIIGDLRDKIKSRTPSPEKSKIGYLRDHINSRSPSPKTSIIGDLRDKIKLRTPSPDKSKIGDLRDKINSRSPSPEKSKIYHRNKINSGGARKKKVTKSRTPPPADYSKLDDNQSQCLIKSKLTTLTLGSLKSLRTSLLNELLEEPLIDLLNEPHSPIQSAESNLKSLPSRVPANLIKENDTLEPSESVPDQQPIETDHASQVPHRESPVKESSGESQASILPMEVQPKELSAEFSSSDEVEKFYVHSSILPVDTHLTEFLIQEKFSKRALSILPVEQSFNVSPVLLEEKKTSKFEESLLHQQTGEFLLPIRSAQLREKSSGIYCSKVLEEKNVSELSQQILNDKINFSLTPFLKLEWQIKNISAISPSDVFEEDNSSLSEQSDETFSPIVKLDWKLKSQEMISSRLPKVNITNDLKEPIPRGKDDKNLSPVLWRKPQMIELPFPVPRSNVGSLKTPEVPVGSLNPEVPVGSLINPNILNCGLCEKTCKRSVVLPCCLAQACNGCAVSDITKNRMCWGCQNPVKSTKELNQDKVLREAIEWFRKNGTIKREHGESLIMRRKIIIERKEKLSKVKKNIKVCDASQLRGKNKRTEAESRSNYALSRKRINEKDNIGYRTPEKSKQEKRGGISRRHSSLTKKPENSKDPEEVSVITRVKRKLLERIESLQNDQERLRLAKSEFQNPICSDPTLNLTFHGYKRRKLLVMQDENVDSFYDFFENPEVVKVRQVKSDERQMFYLKDGNTVSMPGFKKVFKMDEVEDNAPEEDIKEIVRAEEFKVLLENEFRKNNKPLKKLKRSSKKDQFKTRFSHFQAVHSEAINFLQFYKSELERRQVEEIVYLEKLYQKCAVFYGKTKPIFCKSCNVNHKF